MSSGSKRHGLFAALTAFVIAADQASKFAVISLVPLYERIAVVPGFFNIVHYRNPGGAFGLFSDNAGLWMAGIFILVTLAALGLILYLYVQTPPEQPVLAAGLSLVLAGAAGNLIDRLRYGQVIDFLDVYFRTWHWPAFNVADSAITVGMIIFAWHVFFKKTF